MPFRGCVILLLGLSFAAGGAALAADPAPVPNGSPLPAPTPLPVEAPGWLGSLRRSPADDAAELPATRDTQTYVYVVNGFDPFHWAHLKRLADRIRISGYPYTKFGEYFDMPAFEAEYRKIRAENVHARVVLIGYSAGCYPVVASAQRLIREGFPVAMIGFIGGDYLTDSDYNQPKVEKIVNIRGDGFLLTGQNLVWNGSDLRRATNVNLSKNHFALPLRPETFKALYQGLISLPAPTATPATP